MSADCRAFDDIHLHQYVYEVAHGNVVQAFRTFDAALLYVVEILIRRIGQWGGGFVMMHGIRRQDAGQEKFEHVSRRRCIIVTIPRLDSDEEIAIDLMGKKIHDVLERYGPILAQQRCCGSTSCRE